MVPSSSGTTMGDMEANQTVEATLGPVKILRRPRPEPSGTVGTVQGRQQAILNGLVAGQNGLVASNAQSTQANLMSEQHPSDRPTSTKTNSSIYDNDDEWPSIADASKCIGSHKKSQQQQLEGLNVLRKPASTAAKTNSQDETTVRSSEQAVTPSNTTRIDNNASRPMDVNQNKSRLTGPMKTYKERADDYAKARLRILGSACSEEEKHDDVAFR